MKFDIHKLGAIACALGVASARLPGHIAQNWHSHPAILKLRDQHSDNPHQPPPPPPPPGHPHPPPPPPPHDVGEAPVPLDETGEEPSVPPAEPSTSKVEEACKDDFLQFCGDFAHNVVGNMELGHVDTAQVSHSWHWHWHSHMDSFHNGLRNHHRVLWHYGEAEASYPCLGYGMPGDRCLRAHFEELSPDCQSAIDELDTTSSEDGSMEDGTVITEEGVSSSTLVHVWLYGFCWLLATIVVYKLAKRKNKRYQAVKTIMDTLKSNPELKSVVESTAGVEVPEITRIPSCCFFIGSVIMGLYTAVVFAAAIWLTTLYSPPEDSEEGGEEEEEGHGHKHLWVILALVVVLVAFILCKVLRRRTCHHSHNGEQRYMYNGPSHEGYIALTGTVVESPRPPVSPEYCTGVPVNMKPPATVSAAAQAFNPPNVL